MGAQNEANGTASEPIARYDELPILRTYKVALEHIVKIGGFWAVGTDGNLYSIEMPDKVKECMWKDAKRYDIQTGTVIGYTHADRIRAMTDEELAVWMVQWTDCYECVARTRGCCQSDESCASSICNWLKQEADNG